MKTFTAEITDENGNKDRGQWAENGQWMGKYGEIIPVEGKEHPNDLIEVDLTEEGIKGIDDKIRIAQS